MGSFKCIEEIDTWQKARGLVREIYRAIAESKKLASDFGLADQLRRAVVSVSSNIAEGFEREGNKEFRQFLSQAKGSVGEIKAQLYAAFDLGYLPEAEFQVLYRQTDQVGRMIAGLMEYLKQSTNKGRKFSKTTPLKKKLPVL